MKTLVGLLFGQRQISGQVKNGLFIATTEYKAEQDAKNRYPKYFTKITKLGNIPIIRGGEVVQNFGVYQAIKMIKPFARPYGNR